MPRNRRKRPADCTSMHQWEPGQKRVGIAAPCPNHCVPSIVKMAEYHLGAIQFGQYRLDSRPERLSWVANAVIGRTASCLPGTAASSFVADRTGPLCGKHHKSIPGASVTLPGPPLAQVFTNGNAPADYSSVGPGQNPTHNRMV